MQIRIQGQKLQLIRYYSTEKDGKKEQTQSIIVTLDPDMEPGDIPQTVIDKLTPPELRQLTKHLADKSGQRLLVSLKSLVTIIGKARQLVADPETDEALKKSLQEELPALGVKP